MLGVAPQVGAYLVGEVDDGGALREHHVAPFRGEDQEVVVIEGCRHAFHEGVGVGVVAAYVAEQHAEFFHPGIEVGA